MVRTSRDGCVARRTLLTLALFSPIVGSAQGARIAMEVWKSPTCGCCKDWVTPETQGPRIRNSRRLDRVPIQNHPKHALRGNEFASGAAGHVASKIAA